MSRYSRRWTRQSSQLRLDRQSQFAQGLNFCWSALAQTTDLAELLAYNSTDSASILDVGPGEYGVFGRGSSTRTLRWRIQDTTQSSQYTALAFVIDDAGRGSVRSPIDADNPSAQRTWQLRLDADNRIRAIVFNTAGSNFQASGGAVVPDDKRPHAIALRVQGSTATTWFDGTQQASVTVTGTPQTLGTSTSRISVGGKAEITSSQNYPGQVLLCLHWARALADFEIAEISQNPWQLFAPRRIWVPQSAGGGATVALSGAATSFQAGSVAPTASSTVALLGASASFAQGTESVVLSRALSGQASSFAQGTESVNISRALTGASSSFAQGNEAVVVSRALAGSSLAFSAGTVSPGSNVTQALTGASASFAQGTEAVTLTLALAGQSSSFAAGNVAPSQAGTAQLSGQAVSTQAGTLAPSITRALTGVTSTFAAGTITPTQAAIQALSGQAVTLAAGTLAPSVSATVALSGAAVASAAGTVSPTQANIQALSGVSATLAAGTLTPVSSATVALSGLSAAVSLGVVGLPQSATVALVGESLSAVQGNLFIIGAWTPVNDAASNTWAPVNDAASNGWTQITWG